MRVMKTIYLKLCFILLVLFQVNNVFAWEGMPMPQLHVEGRYLKDSYGHIVNLHGFAQTYSPWFNEQNSKWSNYDIAACLKYNQGIIDGIMDAGWKADFIRLHMDPYWSNTPGVNVTGEADISAFNFVRFKKYLDAVFIPMAEYAISKGLYVVIRPPGVCPGEIAVGDEYNQYLIKVWGYVAQHPKLKNNPNIMFELANEPVDILGPDGTYGAGTQGHFDNLKTFFQAVVDTIRASADNILWIPGLGYQSQYQGYAVNPIEGENIGYAVHVYPGWFNSGQGYEPFQRGWDDQVQPVADFAPVIVTEMDWAPEKYNSSWGKDSTGTAGGDGFGANFKKITDDCGNVSWLIFTGPELLVDFIDTPPLTGQAYAFLNDPEACPWPVYHWYQDFAREYSFEGVSQEYLTLSELVVEGSENISVLNNSSVGLKINAVYADGHTENISSVAEYAIDNPEVIKVVRGRIYALEEGKATLNVSYTDTVGVKKQLTLHITSTIFPLTKELFNPGIWGNGTFDETTHTLQTGQWGFGGWQYGGINLSDYKYIVAKLGSNNNADVEFKLFDGNSYWGASTSSKFGYNRQIIVNLKNTKKSDGTLLDLSHIYIAGFWSNGNAPFIIDTVFLTNSNENDATGINDLPVINSGPEIVDVYSITGARIRSQVNREQATNGLPNGVYIVGRKKVLVVNK